MNDGKKIMDSTEVGIVSDDQLADALQHLGVIFLFGHSGEEGALHDQPVLLLASLAASQDARLRLALIPLFVAHPEFSPYVQKAVNGLGENARITLKCYYSAAVYMQKVYHSRLQSLIGLKDPLPDHFSREFGLPDTGDAREQLHRLAQRHEALSGDRLNWLGTYEHAVQVWLRGLEIQNT